MKIPFKLISLKFKTTTQDLNKKIENLEKAHENEKIELKNEYNNNINKQKELMNKNELTFTQKSYRLLTHRATIVKFLLTAVIGFSTYMLFIKISYGLARMEASPYLGILIGAVVEVFACLTTTVLISSRLGRKGSFIIMMTLTIVFHAVAF